jgi:trehalose synthase
MGDDAMTPLQEVAIDPEPIGRFETLIGEARMRDLALAIDVVTTRFADRTWWNVNSTARGGGVAEMLQSLLAYARGAGIDIRWLVIPGNPEFFRITKRLHHALHGMAGDGSPLGTAEHDLYEETLAPSAYALCEAVRPGDVVLLHDPQAAGLAPALLDHGAVVVWRSHIGADGSNEQTALGWSFLHPYLEHVPMLVFSRAGYIPAWCPPERSAVIMPSIDPFAPKNRELDAQTIHAILAQAGVIEAGPDDDRPVEARGGRPVWIDHPAEIVRLGGPLAWETPLVTQVSRWDPLKDPVGVMRGFAELIRTNGLEEPALALVGPDVASVADDPEAVATLEEVRETWQRLPEEVRERIHLVSLPMVDVAENALIINALQRHAAVVVQKSLQEGFGLTVSEAMWKGRPVVASDIGGIGDQIDDGVEGLLLDDPTDPVAFAAALRRVLTDPDLASQLGAAARERVRRDFLPVRHLLDYAALLTRLTGAGDAVEVS